jgi:hypothetical protein
MTTSKNIREILKKTWDWLKQTTFGDTSKQKITELSNENGPLTDKVKIANEFNEFFSTIGTKISNDIPNSSIDPLQYINDVNPNVTPFEFDVPGPIHICDIVKSFQNKSSPDIDSLSLKFIKSIIDVICVPLAHIFRISLETGVFPNKLKTSRVVPIFKSGDHKKCDNYRPITLVSSLSKILEKIVSVKLTNYLQINKLLHPNQYGFQRNMSTEHNLVQVINPLKQSKFFFEFFVHIW